jgi:hypothetical protein
MSTKLNIGNLKRIRAELTNTINLVRTEANNAFDARKISDSEWQQAKDEWGKLETQESELQGLINSLELEFILDTNVESPRSRILQATNRLEAAARNIDEFGSFLSEIAKVIDIFASTITAIQTGGLLTFPTSV